MDDVAVSFLGDARIALGEAEQILAAAMEDARELDELGAAHLLACVERANVLVRCSVRVRRGR